MAATLSFYNQFYAMQWCGLDFDSETIKVMLLDSTYTFDATDADTSDVLGAGTSPEVPNGDGYTTGGETVGNTEVVATGTSTALMGDDVTWTELTATFRYAVYYIDGEVGGVTDPVLCCVLLDSTPANIVVSGVDYTLLHSTSGIFTSSEV